MLHGEAYYKYYRDERGFDAAAKGDWQHDYVKFLRAAFPPGVLTAGPILDVGAACGALTSAMLDAGLNAWAIEPEEYFCRISPFENLRGRLLCCPVERILFRDHEFAFVHCSQVLEHVPPDRIADALRELNQVAQPGAIMYMASPFYGEDALGNLDDVTHLTRRPRAWWEERLSCQNWTPTDEFDAAIAAQPMAQRQKWTWIVARRS